ncbi:MAG: hypothetical protein J7L15_03690 [Clostridiales bacterium]|nr:hypothetical protein [Clostridiales bacterium]
MVDELNNLGSTVDPVMGNQSMDQTSPQTAAPTPMTEAPSPAEAIDIFAEVESPPVTVENPVITNNSSVNAISPMTEETLARPQKSVVGKVIMIFIFIFILVVIAFAGYYFWPQLSNLNRQNIEELSDISNQNEEDLPDIVDSYADDEIIDDTSSVEFEDNLLLDTDYSYAESEVEEYEELPPLDEGGEDVFVNDEDMLNLEKDLSIDLEIEIPIINLDTDGDGLTDKEEKELGTNLYKADTDNDGLLDREEIFIYKTNPLEEDSDGD